MNEGKKYPHEREYDEHGRTPQERQADMQYEIAKGVYRGQKWAKNGWDPGDPDEPTHPFIYFLVFIGIVIAILGGLGLRPSDLGL